MYKSQPLTRALLTARSAVRLKPVQIYGRFFSPPGKPLSPGSTANVPHWKGLPGLPQICKECSALGHDTGALIEGRFSFLNRQITFPEEVNWSAPETERLWRYHLHYLGWALALALDGSPRCLTVLEKRVTEWLQSNLPGSSEGWEPFPLSLRIVNLAYILSLTGVLSTRLTEILRASLAVQVRALLRGIEHSLQGNHLVKNGKALLVAGLAYQGPEAEKWFRSGFALLEREMEAQVYQDGGHGDRCAMYQAQVLLDYLESIALLKAAGRPFPKDWHKRLEAMVVYLDAICHPDGLPALFGDTSISCIPPKERLVKLARDLGIKTEFLDGCASHEFPDSSYVIARDLRRGNYLILDSGAQGNAIESAHYHCQFFSYELSLAGRRVVTDTGVSSYEIGPERTLNRSSWAHNTVSWKNREPAEIWGAFRLARRAQILCREVECAAAGALRFKGRMKGFYPGATRGCWEREVGWMPEGRLEIVDTWLAPKAIGNIVSRIHFAPGLRLSDEGGGNWGIYADTGPRISSLQVSQGTATLTRTPYHPSFGESHDRDCIEITLVKNSARYRILSALSQ